jgi:hypothetical protein
MSLRSTPAPDRSRSPKWAVTLRRNDRSPSTETTGHDRRNTQRDAWYVQAGVLNATHKLYRTMRADCSLGGVVESFGAPRTREVRLGFEH